MSSTCQNAWLAFEVPAFGRRVEEARGALAELVDHAAVDLLLGLEADLVLVELAARAHDVLGGDVGVHWGALQHGTLLCGMTTGDPARNNPPMTIKLNHTIVHSLDPRAAAEFYSALFGLPAPEPFGPFLDVVTANEVTLAFLSADGMEIQMQHYAFLVSEKEFDQIFGRIQEQGLSTGPIPDRSRRARSTTTSAAAASTSRTRAATCSRSSPSPTESFPSELRLRVERRRRRHRAVYAARRRLAAARRALQGREDRGADQREPGQALPGRRGAQQAFHRVRLCASIARAARSSSSAPRRSPRAFRTSRTTAPGAGCSAPRTAPTW